MKAPSFSEGAFFLRRVGRLDGRSGLYELLAKGYGYGFGSI
jgi:hypothetical protein